MTVKTPEYWKEYELIEETTAYGNKVMIPEICKCAWEMEQLRQQHLQKNEVELKRHLGGLKNWLENICQTPMGADMVRVFWEIYEENI